MDTTLATLHDAAESILGPCQWEADGLRGLCQCPGVSSHTGKNAKLDTTVFLDGAPTIYCFHTGCATIVAQANLRLRRKLNSGGDWELILPNGNFIRSGERAVPAGQPIPIKLPKQEVEVDAEKVFVQEIEARMLILRDRLFEKFAWEPSDMADSSPQPLSENQRDDWLMWLSMWGRSDVIWVGDTFDSGQKRHAANFRTAADWEQSAPSGQFTCGSSFHEGCFSRKNEHAQRRFMVIESDTLTHPQIGAVFQWLQKKLKYTLFAVVNTGGKSLHGWFNLPPSPLFESRLKAAIVAIGCDAALFKPSQPVRVPGIMRSNGNPQTLLWFRRKEKTHLQALATLLMSLPCLG
jgi:hypothetical protein